MILGADSYPFLIKIDPLEADLKYSIFNRKYSIIAI